MVDTFLLEIVTPRRLALSEPVDEATFPGIEGEFGVLPGHTPFLTQLKIGVLHFKKGRDVEYVAVNKGFVEVTPRKVTVLTETAELKREIDVARAEEAKKRAEERLRSRAEEIDFARARAALDRATTRLKVARL